MTPLHMSTAFFVRVVLCLAVHVLIPGHEEVVSTEMVFIEGWFLDKKASKVLGEWRWRVYLCKIASLHMLAGSLFG